jgi:shikimate dehydrogenase
MTDAHGDGAPHGSYALLGWPLEHSLSPVLHDAAFAALGIDARYTLRPTPADELALAVDAVRSGALAGANVTLPHKETVRRLLDDESELATALGAVNTLVRTPHGVRGENTDVAGFRHALSRIDAADGSGRRAVVLGAGGAARAVAYTLLRSGYSVRVLNRSAGPLGLMLATLYRALPGAMLSSDLLSDTRLLAAASRADLLVNTTPVGAAPGPAASLWPKLAEIPARLTVVDIVAWPPETELVRRARAAGATAIGGLSMLLGQAAASFELWTGREAPLDAMRSALREAIDDAAAVPDGR